MPRLTPAELRFQLRRALQELPRSTLRDICGNPEMHERGLRAAEEVLFARLGAFEVIAPDAKPMDWGDMKN